MKFSGNCNFLSKITSYTVVCQYHKDNKLLLSSYQNTWTVHVASNTVPCSDSNNGISSLITLKRFCETWEKYKESDNKMWDMKSFIYTNYSTCTQERKPFHILWCYVYQHKSIMNWKALKTLCRTNNLNIFEHNKLLIAFDTHMDYGGVLSPGLDDYRE